MLLSGGGLMEREKTAEDNRRTAFERLYDEYYDKIYVYLYRRVNNQHTAEDLTANVFLKAFANPYNPRLAKFSTYIYTIASNVLKNHYRAISKSNGNISYEDIDGSFSGQTDIAGDLITREEYAQLGAVLAELPERQYAVIYRRYYLEQSFKEIGEDLGVTDTYARKIHERALDALKKSC